EGVLLLEEGDGTTPGGGDLLTKTLLHSIDPVGVHIAHLTQCGRLALGTAQIGQPSHPPLRRAGGLTPGTANERGDLLLGLMEGPGCLLGEFLDGLELVQDPFRGVTYLRKWAREVTALLLTEPMEPVHDPTARSDERLEDLGGGLHVLGHPCHRQTLGNTPVHAC